eukprot:g28856.t1
MESRRGVNSTPHLLDALDARLGSRCSRAVVLMGDSVLDNFFWLQTPTRHLRVQLQEQLAKSRNAKAAFRRGAAQGHGDPDGGKELGSVQRCRVKKSV